MSQGVSLPCVFRATAVAAFVASTILIPATATHAALVEASNAQAPALTPALFASATASNGIEVSIDEVSPRILTTQNELLVTGAVTNTGQNPLPAPILELSVGAWTPISVASLEAELSSPDPWEATVSTQVLASDVNPGETLPFEIRVAVEYLPLGDETSWGPRTLTVSASSQDAFGRDRSLLIWDSGRAVDPTRINTLVPWTSQNTKGGDAERRAVLSIAATPGATLAMDADVLPTPRATLGSDAAADAPTDAEAASDAGSDKDSPDTLTTQLSARDQLFTSSLFEAASEVVALPQGDACLATLAVSGAEDLLHTGLSSADTFADTMRHLYASESGEPTVITNVTWPSDAAFSTTALAALSDRVTIAPQGALATIEESLDFTPSSAVSVDATTGYVGSGVTVLTQNEQIAQLLDWQTNTAADELDAQQGLAAVTAIITRERPNAARTLFAATSRQNSVTPALAERVSTLLNARWVTPVSFQEVVDAEPSDVEREAVYDQALPAESEQAVAIVTGAWMSLEGLARASSDPKAVTDLIANDLLPAVSASVTPQIQLARASSVESRVVTLRSKITSAPSDAVNLINKSADFPVSIRNDLDWDVDVVVTISPTDPRLSVTAPATATLKAKSVTSVGVPVTAIGSGNIDVTYQVYTPEGEMLLESPSILVRMRAGWEDALTLAAATVFALLFVGGLVRTVRAQIARAKDAASTEQPAPEASAPDSAGTADAVKEVK